MADAIPGQSDVVHLDKVKIGFAGSRTGMTDTQIQKVKEVLAKYDVVEVHHGDCLGADAQFHDICTEKGLKIIVHPPLSKEFRAFKTTGSTTILTEKAYNARNTELVESCDFFIGCPAKWKTNPHSGTWKILECALQQKMSAQIFPKDLEYHL
jgi:hypothetical protein